MAATALLAVFTEPGPDVDLADYHDWYDNEHIPPRALAVPTFLNITRWEAVDGKTPDFLVTYDMTTPDGAKHPTNQIPSSEREKRLYGTMRLGDIRVYTIYEGPALPPSALHDLRQAAPIISWVDFEPVDEAEANKWYDEEHIPMLSKVPGWVRSRRFVYKEGFQLGPKASQPYKPPRWISVHEWASPDVATASEMKAAMETPLAKKILGESKHEVRIFKQIKHWAKE